LSGTLDRPLLTLIRLLDGVKRLPADFTLHVFVINLDPTLTERDTSPLANNVRLNVAMRAQFGRFLHITSF
jgi:hypothetical protein